MPTKSQGLPKESLRWELNDILYLYYLNKVKWKPEIHSFILFKSSPFSISNENDKGFEIFYCKCLIIYQLRHLLSIFRVNTEMFEIQVSLSETVDVLSFFQNSLKFIEIFLSSLLFLRAIPRLFGRKARTEIMKFYTNSNS